MMKAHHLLCALAVAWAATTTTHAMERTKTNAPQRTKTTNALQRTPTNAPHHKHNRHSAAGAAPDSPPAAASVLRGSPHSPRSAQKARYDAEHAKLKEWHKTQMTKIHNGHADTMANLKTLHKARLQTIRDPLYTRNFPLCKVECKSNLMSERDEIEASWMGPKGHEKLASKNPEYAAQVARLASAEDDYSTKQQAQSEASNKVKDASTAHQQIVREKKKIDTWLKEPQNDPKQLPEKSRAAWQKKIDTYPARESAAKQKLEEAQAERAKHESLYGHEKHSLNWEVEEVKDAEKQKELDAWEAQVGRCIQSCTDAAREGKAPAGNDPHLPLSEEQVAGGEAGLRVRRSVVDDGKVKILGNCCSEPICGREEREATRGIIVYHDRSGAAIPFFRSSGTSADDTYAGSIGYSKKGLYVPFQGFRSDNFPPTQPAICLQADPDHNTCVAKLWYYKYSQPHKEAGKSMMSMNYGEPYWLTKGSGPIIDAIKSFQCKRTAPIHQPEKVGDEHHHHEENKAEVPTFLDAGMTPALLQFGFNGKSFKLFYCISAKLGFPAGAQHECHHQLAAAIGCRDMGSLADAVAPDKWPAASELETIPNMQGKMKAQTLATFHKEAQEDDDPEDILEYYANGGADVNEKADDQVVMDAVQYADIVTKTSPDRC